MEQKLVTDNCCFILVGRHETLLASCPCNRILFIIFFGNWLIVYQTLMNLPFLTIYVYW